MMELRIWPEISDIMMGCKFCEQIFMTYDEFLEHQHLKTVEQAVDESWERLTWAQ